MSWIVEHHAWLCRAQLLLAVPTALVLLFISAPYGRHARSGWGPRIGARAGWVLMESPALVGFGALYALGPHALEPAPLALLGLWLLHYVNRAVVYPLRMSASARPMPLIIALLGVGFNVLNAAVNAPQVSRLGAYANAWLLDPRFLGGAALFVTGWCINLHSDAVLRRLRAHGETGYKVPSAGLHRWVSSPNYLGELLEWTGWAMATWSLAGVAFAVYTAANLVPRAITHRRWYRQTFPEYPRERRAILPWVL